MNFHIPVLVALLCSCSIARSQKDPDPPELSVALHYTDGLTAKSTPPSELPQVILFKSHTHIHFKITNTCKKPLLLWRPGCPAGDIAMRIEFRNPDQRDKVYTSSILQIYTGGMGVPKTLKLAPNDDLIVNVDFTGGWEFPFTLDKDRNKVIEMRAVYQSRPLTANELKHYELLGAEFAKEATSIWKGTVSSAWEKAHISNRTGKKVGPVKTVENSP